MKRLLGITTILLLLSACQQATQNSAMTVINGHEAVAGQIIVKLRPSSDSSFTTLARTQLLEQGSDASWGSLMLVQVPRGQELAFAESYAKRADVEYAEPNYWVRNVKPDIEPVFLESSIDTQVLPDPISDPFFVEVPSGDPFATSSVGGSISYQNVPYLWGVFRINADQAWASGVTGAGVVVAVLDEGTDLEHPDIKPNLWTNPNPSSTTCPGLHGYDFVDDDTDPTDTGGHGTHTAGTIAAAANGIGIVGVAPEAKIMVLRGLGFFGGTNYMLVRGLKYAADCGADVVNNSWGGSTRTKAFKDAIEYGVAKGTTYVFSAGNSYGGGNPISNPVSYSTEIDGLIGVGASSPDNARTGFSNAGDYVTVVAPGTGIMSTIPVAQSPASPYAFLQGTSMAAPHVTGVVALLYQAKPSITPAEVRTALEVTANDTLTAQSAQPDYSDASRPGWYGFGLVDAKAAVDYAKSH
jgi:subtilisin family serine protease